MIVFIGFIARKYYEIRFEEFLLEEHKNVHNFQRWMKFMHKSGPRALFNVRDSFLFLRRNRFVDAQMHYVRHAVYMSWFFLTNSCHTVYILKMKKYIIELMWQRQRGKIDSRKSPAQICRIIINFKFRFHIAKICWLYQRGELYKGEIKASCR